MTAVEWLVNEIDMQYPQIDIKWKQWMINQAKAMEKEQIEIAFDLGRDELGCKLNDIGTGEKYYNETYGE